MGNDYESNVQMEQSEMITVEKRPGNDEILSSKTEGFVSIKISHDVPVEKMKEIVEELKKEDIEADVVRSVFEQ